MLKGRQSKAKFDMVFCFRINQIWTGKRTSVFGVKWFLHLAVQYVMPVWYFNAVQLKAAKFYCQFNTNHRGLRHIVYRQNTHKSATTLKKKGKSITVTFWTTKIPTVHSTHVIQIDMDCFAHDLSHCSYTVHHWFRKQQLDSEPLSAKATSGLAVALNSSHRAELRYSGTGIPVVLTVAAPAGRSRSCGR